MGGGGEGARGGGRVGQGVLLLNDTATTGIYTLSLRDALPIYMTLGPQWIEALKKNDAGDILVVCGGVIPVQDYDFLFEKGVVAVYGPGTNIPAAAAEIVEIIGKRRLAAE